jgi:hypothetical protein
MPLGSRTIEAIVEKHIRDTIALYRAIPEVESIPDDDMLETVLSEKPSPV